MGDDAYKEFLVKCAGFGDSPWDQELGEILPKWRDAAKKLGLTERDIEYATKQYIPRNFDIRLEGVRKTIGSVIVELSDVMMAKDYKEKGKKVVYGVLPGHSSFYRALKMTSQEVNVFFPDCVMAASLNPFFHKIAPLLEVAEEHGMRAGCRHCSLNKTRYAALMTGLIPTPHVSWIWGFACDQSPKSDEFIKEYWNKEYPTVFSRIPHDGPAHFKEYQDEERVKHLGGEMRYGYERVCQAVGIEVSERAIKDALDERLNFIIRYRQVLELLAEDPPPFSGQISVFLILPTSEAWNTGYKYANAALEALTIEAQERVSKGIGVVPKGSPTAMAWFIPYNNPFVNRMFEENGVALSYSEGMLPSKAEFESPKFTDVYDANAEALLKSSKFVNWGTKADLAIEKMETYGVDCMIWGFLDFDRWLGSDHKLCSRYVTEKTGKPSFYVEGDIWEDRDYSEETLRTRIETICEVLKARMIAKT